MSAIGIVAALLVAAFALHQSSATPTAAAVRTLITWTLPAAALVLIGCYILLRSDRTPTLATNH